MGYSVHPSVNLAKLIILTRICDMQTDMISISLELSASCTVLAAFPI